MYQAIGVIELKSIAKGIEATDEDKKEFYAKIEADYGENAENIKSMIDEDLMAKDIIHRKAAEIIYSNAIKTEPEPEEDKSADEAPAAEAEAEEGESEEAGEE